MHPAPIPTQPSTVQTESDRCADFHGPQAEQFVGASHRARVGLGRFISTAVRRARFAGRFIYRTCRHGSTKHAGWVCNFEGLWW